MLTRREQEMKRLFEREARTSTAQEIFDESLAIIKLLREQIEKYDENHVALVNLIEEICASAKFLIPEIAVEEIKKEVNLARSRGVKFQEEIE